MELLMENPDPCSHPLQSPGPRMPLCPVDAMDDLAVIHDRHGLKASMRVGLNAWPARRLELVRTPVVEQQTRAEFVSKLIMREDPTNGESIPDPVLFSVTEHIDALFKIRPHFTTPRPVARVRRVLPDSSRLLGSGECCFPDAAAS